jgi:serine/threonine protein kinase
MRLAKDTATIISRIIESPTQNRSELLRKAYGPDDLLQNAVELLVREVKHNQGRRELLGQVVGAYRIISLLGVGGAGTVYLAERADRQYSAQVAVKIVESALLHHEVGHRFRAERQILASLNHANIARLLDAGETTEGQPYLVMEYVQGIPIDRYCDSQQLSIEERLNLFVKVCGAVQYAHQNLIVHRDLKPANILVTEDGTPKLLDFGIAKLLDTDQATAALALTRMNDQLLTPEYASPEQILGRPVTTTSDVYTLGVVLYELLAGMRPYLVKSDSSQLELERAICVSDPVMPSARFDRSVNDEDLLKRIAEARGTQPQRLRKQLAGDLDAIVMRALRKEPQRRYATVLQFEEDILRHLSGKKVHAGQVRVSPAGLLKRFSRKIAWSRGSRTKEERFLEKFEELKSRYPEVEPILDPRLDRLEDALVLQQEFMRIEPVLSNTALHERADHAGRNTLRLMESWHERQQIFSVRYYGKDFYPAFQFDDAGQPYPLVERVLGILRKDSKITEWDIAIWFTSPTGALNGSAPKSMLNTYDEEAIALLMRAAEQEIATDDGG